MEEGRRHDCSNGPSAILPPSIKARVQRFRHPPIRGATSFRPRWGVESHLIVEEVGRLAGRVTIPSPTKELVATWDRPTAAATRDAAKMRDRRRAVVRSRSSSASADACVSGAGVVSEETFLDAAAVLAALSSLDGIHHSLESGLRSVVSDAEALIADGWVGTAGEAFRDHFQQVRAEAEQLLIDAREIVGRIPDVVSELSSVDDSNSEQIGRQAPSSLNIRT